MFLIAPFFSLTSSAQGGGAATGNFRYFPVDDQHYHHLNDHSHHYYNTKAIITEMTITATAQSYGVLWDSLFSLQTRSLSLCSVFTSLPLATSTYHFHLHLNRSSERGLTPSKNRLGISKGEVVRLRTDTFILINHYDR